GDLLQPDKNVTGRVGTTFALGQATLSGGLSAMSGQTFFERPLMTPPVVYYAFWRAAFDAELTAGPLLAIAEGGFGKQTFYSVDPVTLRPASPRGPTPSQAGAYLLVGWQASGQVMPSGR